MTDIAKRLGWDEPPLNERGNQEPRAAAIPQGEDFLLDPPDEFTVPKWNLRYRKLESKHSYVSYICDNGRLVDHVIFLRNSRSESYDEVMGLLRGSDHRHYFHEQQFGVASLAVELSKRTDQYHKQYSGWSTALLKETIGIDSTERIRSTWFRTY